MTIAQYLNPADILQARTTALREGSRTAIEDGIPHNAMYHAREYEAFLLDGLVKPPAVTKPSPA